MRFGQARVNSLAAVALDNIGRGALCTALGLWLAVGRASGLGRTLRWIHGANSGDARVCRYGGMEVHSTHRLAKLVLKFILVAGT